MAALLTPASQKLRHKVANQNYKLIAYVSDFWSRTGDPTVASHFSRLSGRCKTSLVEYDESMDIKEAKSLKDNKKEIMEFTTCM
jgi:hypothetical protein